MRSRCLLVIFGLSMVMLAVQPASIALAQDCGKAINCNVDSGGASVGMTRVVLDRAKKGLDLQTGEPDKRVFEYTSATSCASSIAGGANADVPCAGAIQACTGNTPQQGQGPQVRLYRRELDAKGVPLSQTWDLLGTTCFPELVPGKAVVGLGQILAAFHNTAWAKPRVHIQPEGNITLVTLKTYFQVQWSSEGYQPGEIDATTLLSNRVQIRPTLSSYTYVFGDATSSEPTTSPGGPYPDGNITHVYSKAGTYNSRIDVTYGGQYRVGGGGAWTTIPETVTVAGPPQSLTVKTAHARLVIE
jgi:hypothetical protein